MNCITEQDLNEMNIEIIRSSLYKVCLLFKFCFRLSRSFAGVH